jgi:2-amino-4-hydroxy-6-hydroxymethyldihydropteridine diphosphokinase
VSVVAYIGFGANLGARETAFHGALQALAALPRTDVRGNSRLYETDPVGLVDRGPVFLNAVIEVETDLSAADLMAAMGRIELDLGKAPDHRSDRSRVIDLDLLLYGDQIVREPGITVPHARMHARAFVLVPLDELAPDVMVPMVDRSVRDLLQDLPEAERKGVRSFGSCVTEDS